MSKASDLLTTRDYTIDDIPPSNADMWITIFDERNRPHVIPDFGPHHVTASDCWCHPQIDNDRYDEKNVMVHNVAQ